jgi:hypothetical protein
MNTVSTKYLNSYFFWDLLYKLVYVWQNEIEKFYPYNVFKFHNTNRIEFETKKEAMEYIREIKKDIREDNRYTENIKYKAYKYINNLKII